MSTRLVRALILALALSGCGDDAPPLDASMPDGGFVDDAAAPDADVLPACEVPAPLVGGTPETDAIADAPPRCNAPSTPWLRSERLGEIVTRLPGSHYTPRLLQGLAAAADVTLPRAPEHAVATETIAYVTQDRGRLRESSAIVAYPTDLASRDSLPIVLVLHGTSGFRAECGPSADANTQALAAVVASLGWIAVAPDYLGLESVGEAYGALHPYLVGEATAVASLDAVRAVARVVASEGGTLCAAPQLAVFGGSQGGHATLFVDRLAPYYAREFEMLGAVATVPVADLIGQSERALGELVQSTGNFVAALATQAPWYESEALVSDVLASPYDVDVPAALGASCNPGRAVDPDSFESFFTADFLADVAEQGVANLEPFGCWLRENSLTATSIPRLGPSSPSYGLLFVVGEEDRLIHPPIERDAYDTLCAAGMPLEYLECAGAGHVPATLWALPEVLDFLDARRAGEPFVANCTRPAASRCRGTPDGA